MKLYKNIFINVLLISIFYSTNLNSNKLFLLKKISYPSSKNFYDNLETFYCEIEKLIKEIHPIDKLKFKENKLIGIVKDKKFEISVINKQEQTNLKSEKMLTGNLLGNIDSISRNVYYSSFFSKDYKHLVLFSEKKFSSKYEFYIRIFELK